MLTDDETRLLLAHVMAYDARIQPGQATIAAWSEASRRGRWTYAEALEAVHEHYATRTDWLMPGTVTQAIRAGRQDAAMRAAALPPPTPDPIGQRRLAAVTAAAFPAVPDDDTPAAPQPAGPLTRPCPFCHARPGEHCTRRGLTVRVQLAKAHPSRQEAS